MMGDIPFPGFIVAVDIPVFPLIDGTYMTFQKVPTHSQGTQSTKNY